MEIVKSATRTMTSVPKPFKFLKTYYKPLTDYFATLKDGSHRVIVYIKNRSNLLISFQYYL